MRKVFLAIAALAVGATSVMAQSDPIATRKATMKKVGEGAAAVGKIAKGEAPFDLATVQAALKTMEDAAKVMPTLFPDNSKTGGDTAALPKVWETKADFDAKWAKLGADASAAAAKIKDDAMKATAPRRAETRLAAS